MGLQSSWRAVGYCPDRSATAAPIGSCRCWSSLVHRHHSWAGCFFLLEASIAYFLVRSCLESSGSVSEVHGALSDRDLPSTSGGGGVGWAELKTTAIVYKVLGSLLDSSEHQLMRGLFMPGTGVFVSLWFLGRAASSDGSCSHVLCSAIYGQQSPSLVCG